MDLIGIEEITPHEGVAKFNIYKYSDEIDLGNKEQFVCNLKLIMLRINPIYADRMGKNADMLALVEDLNPSIDKNNIKQYIEKFILDEIWEEDIKKDNIKMMFIEG